MYITFVDVFLDCRNHLTECTAANQIQPLVVAGQAPQQIHFIKNEAKCQLSILAQSCNQEQTV